MNSKLITISAIAAISENGVIGNENKLLWNIPEDMKRFRSLTNGHPVIMGRKTFESIGKPLPNRTNIIITRDQNFKVEGCVVVHSIEEALEAAKHAINNYSLSEHSESKGNLNQDQASTNSANNEIFIIGGGQIYTQALPYTDKLYLTIVHQEFTGDTRFPDYSQFTKEVFREDAEANGLKYTFVDLKKS